MAAKKKKKVVRRTKRRAGGDDFLPAGVTREKQSPKFPGELCTYLLSTDKRGHAQVEAVKGVLLTQHRGYRAIVLGRPGLDFSGCGHTEIVGKQEGNHYDELIGWALTSRMAELHQQYAESGGATAAAKRKAMTSYDKARANLDAANQAAERAERELDLASEELVITHGPTAIEIDGEEHIASMVRERIYWRLRPLMPQDIRAAREEAGEEVAESPGEAQPED